MSRAKFYDVARDTYGRPVSGVTVTVYETGTTTLVAGPLYAAATGGTTLSNPFTTTGDGDIEFWLAGPAVVDVRYAKTGLATETHTAVVNSAAIPVDEKGAANGVASLDADGRVPADQVPGAEHDHDHDHDADYEPLGAAAALVDAAPGALDTLNELAAALGDDANFASTVTAALAGKAATTHEHDADYSPTAHDHSGTYVPTPAVAPTVGQILSATDDDPLTTDWIDAPTGGGGGGGGSAIFGDGSDGAVTIASGTTSLTRDMYYDTLVVQNGGILKTAGFKIFCKTSCTVDSGGTIERNGAPSTSNVGGLAGDPGSFHTGAMSSGSAGGTGVGVRTGALTNSLGGGNGAGGAGSGGAGGIARAASGVAASMGGYRHVPQAITGLVYSGVSTIALGAGVGGSSGGGDGTNLGGGGGGGGGIMILAAKAITNDGTIAARGGAGYSTTAGNTGGGGGGGGGVIFVIYDTYTGTAPSVTGGAGGSGFGTGGAGNAGQAGLVVSLSNA